MMDTTVHVFAGKFRDINDAWAYSEANWEPEPPATVIDDDYRVWEEDRNPIWLMKADLGVKYLDSDFIETIDDLNRYDYLREMLKNPRDIERIRTIAGPEANILVLVFHEALGGFDAQVDGWAPKSTLRLTCCGAFPCTI